MDGFKTASILSEEQTSIEAGKYPRLELPLEMLEMFFAHSGNLLQLTLVCPTFNDVISKSPLLMRRLKVTWMASTPNLCLLQSDRKYGRLHLHRVDPNSWQQLRYFIEKHKRTLIDLEIDLSFKLEPRQYFECLSTLSENLKMLKAWSLPEEIASMGVLEFPKLEELTWSSINRLMLQAWKTPKLKKFLQTGVHELVSLNLETINGNSTISFLRDQPQLQSLKILNSSYGEFFLKAASISPFSFKLASFIIYADFRSLNIFPFLESQRQSLKVLSLESGWFDLQEADLRNILKLELEELELITNDYPSIGPSIVQNKTIKKLTLSLQCFSSTNSDTSVSFIESCSNVETLSLEFFEVSKALSSAIASKLTKLKSFTVTSTTFDFPLCEMDRYPSVETFSAECVDRQVSKSFVAANPQLRVLIFDHSPHLTTEIRFIKTLSNHLFNKNS